jgi:hypothetical protein
MTGRNAKPAGRTSPLERLLALREKFGGSERDRERVAGKGRGRASFNLRNRLGMRFPETREIVVVRP